MPHLQKIKNPHDRYFKANMQDIRVARSFFEAHLPQNILSRIDFDTLTLESGTFVGKELEELLSDLLYSVKIENCKSYLYFLSEHQSTIPELMPFRCLQYNVAIMNNHLKQIPKDEPKFLPLVVNIVFYHGKETPYVYSRDLFDYFEEPDLARELMFKPFTLIDVNQIPDDELAKHRWAALFQLMQKHSRERDMLPFLEKLFSGGLKIEISDYGDLVYVMIKYLAETGEVSDKKRVIDLLKQAAPEGDDKMTTLAQSWYQDGEHKTTFTIAKNMISEKINVDLIKKVTGLTDQDILKITQNHSFTEEGS